MVTVKDGWAVQSIGYARYLPLGRPAVLVENLDRWGADEIMVNCIDRSARGLGPDFELLTSLSSLGLSTPLIYGGGIRNVEDAVAVVQAGADRVSVDALLRDDPDSAGRLGDPLGAQAVIAALPLTVEAGAPQWYDYRTRSAAPISDALAALLTSGRISEAMLIDVAHDGGRAAFDPALIDAFPVPNIPLIAFGGITSTDQLSDLLQRPRVVAAAVGNSLNYGEHRVQALKAALAGLPLRPATFEARVVA